MHAWQPTSGVLRCLSALLWGKHPTEQQQGWRLKRQWDSILQVAEPSALLECLQSLVNSKDLNLDEALSLFTKNPANRLKLARKGQVGLKLKLPFFCLLKVLQHAGML